MSPKLSQTIKLTSGTERDWNQRNIQWKNYAANYQQEKKSKKKDNTSKGGRGERKDKTKKIIVYKI